MLNCIAKLLYQLIPAAFPHNLAQGDVFDLIKQLQDIDFDTINFPRFTTKTWQVFSPA
jgi:predicted methyltransferase